MKPTKPKAKEVRIIDNGKTKNKNWKTMISSKPFINGIKQCKKCKNTYDLSAFNEDENICMGCVRQAEAEKDYSKELWRGLENRIGAEKEPKCSCGEQVCLGGAEVELGGVRHRPDNPCYHMHPSKQAEKECLENKWQKEHEDEIDKLDTPSPKPEEKCRETRTCKRCGYTFNYDDFCGGTICNDCIMKMNLPPASK